MFRKELNESGGDTHDEVYVPMVEVVEGYVRACCWSLMNGHFQVVCRCAPVVTPFNSIHSAISPSRRGLDCSEVSPSPSGCVVQNVGHSLHKTAYEPGSLG